MRSDYMEELESALIDILDGQSRWDEVQYLTGCSEERSREIEQLFIVCVSRYHEKHNIKDKP